METAIPVTAKTRRRQADIREFRRRSLLRSALETLAEQDIDGATVALICARADASRGLIGHYFSSKEELLVAALRGLFDEAQKLKTEIACDESLSALERIRRIAHSSFKAPIYRWETAAAWQAFTNASRYNPAFREPIRESTQQSVNTVEPLFRQLASETRLRVEAPEAAMGLFILIDGLWNSLATGKDDLRPARAIEHCNIYIEGCLAQS